MDFLRCVVERTTYQSTETGFSVLQCRAKGYPDLVTVVGNMPEVHSGSVLTLVGVWKIHKAQGSEYPIVVMPLLMTHYVMLQRNLIYTGITRAKKVFVLIGEKKALGYAVRNMTVSKRNTLLKQRLQGGLVQ